MFADTSAALQLFGTAASISVLNSSSVCTCPVDHSLMVAPGKEIGEGGHWRSLGPESLEIRRSRKNSRKNILVKLDVERGSVLLKITIAFIHVKGCNELCDDNDIPVEARVTINCFLRENETPHADETEPYSKYISPETFLVHLHTSECEIILNLEDPLCPGKQPPMPLQTKRHWRWIKYSTTVGDSVIAAHRWYKLPEERKLNTSLS